MIRICHGEVFQCMEESLDLRELVSFFEQSDHERAIVQVIDDQGGHVGLITISEVVNLLKHKNAEKFIDREYITLTSRMFDEANSYYERNAKNKYCPVLNEKREIEFFAYFDGAGEDTLALLHVVGYAKEIAQELLDKKYGNVTGAVTARYPEEGAYQGINIWGLNEIGFRLAELLRERGGIPFAVIGEYWDLLGFTNHECIEDGYNLCVEGNRALPLSEMGKWRFEFPGGVFSDDFNIRLCNIINGASLFGARWRYFDQARQNIYDALVSGEPFMAGRLGVTEGKITDAYIRGERYPAGILQWLYRTSGFFSKDGAISIEDVDHFAERELEAVKDTDLHIYLEQHAVSVINRFAKEGSIVSGFGLLLHDNVACDDSVSWIAGLAGKKVLVISPFEDTVRQQYEKRKDIYSGNKCLPDFELKTFQMLETQNGITCGFDSFFDAYDYMINQIRQIEFEVALIAGGAYGYLLAHDIKKMGKISIQLSSYLMPLFGIKIKRHATNIFVNPFWNEHWSFPKEEPVKNAGGIENACYWEG